MKRKRKNLKLNVSNLYIAMALVFVFGFAIFGTSKIFLAEETPINQTELKKEFDLRTDGKLQINKWIYDEEQKMMEVVLVTSGMKDYTTDLEFTAVSKKNVNQELPVEVVLNDNDIFILQVKDVPNNFDQLAIRLHKSQKALNTAFTEDEQAEQESNTFSTIYTDERVVDRKRIDQQDAREYTNEITDELIVQTKEKQDLTKTEIENLTSINEEIQKGIEELQSELLYQTADEQIETNNTIYKLTQDIEMNNKKIEEKQADIHNLNAKIEKLEQKKRDMSI
ncbi:hypothetical protein [Bhargavaea beijingensis]|uniref:hypothetical protein n=1 Tax=Bhargavaea beijingensis TaxID=426756 RepID=UPI0022245D08|nr:hypothetical protein [Bhargavaea beijingensis]MCW1929574.1 hypothetical protein [Bhargavaea beijingensis]